MGARSNHTTTRSQEIRSLSPEARRHQTSPLFASQPGASGAFISRFGPGSRPFEVLRRTAFGTYNDGFTHAGNLAYLSMLAIFPFFILGSAAFELIGGKQNSQALVETVLVAMPPAVNQVIAPVAADTMESRSGWVLWFGAAVALWTVSSLIESIRDILRRAYGTQAQHAFWRYRLISVGFILGAVVLLMVSLFAQVSIGAAHQLISARLPELDTALSTLQVSRIVPAFGLTISLYLLFLTLTPADYSARRYPKWPGALFTAVWWLGVSSALPPILTSFFTYNLTYGSMAGIIITLFFFWLVGLGLVIGAELNAALAEPEFEGIDEKDT